MKPIYSPSDIPDNMTERELQEFWATHFITETYMRMVEEAAKWEHPQPRSEGENEEEVQ